jgi:hypothetical protein
MGNLNRRAAESAEFAGDLGDGRPETEDRRPETGDRRPETEVDADLLPLSRGPGGC